MAKIDYSKAEREMHDSLQRMRLKSLAEGKSVTSQRAAEFYGIDEKEPRPTPQEPVAKLVRVEAAITESDDELKKQTEKLASQPSKKEPFHSGVVLPQAQTAPPIEIPEEPEFLIINQTPKYDVMRRARKESPRPPRFIAPPTDEVPSSDMFFKPTSILYVLRQHLFWLKRRHCENRYEILGTSREEVTAFRKTKRLDETQLARIKEINTRAEEVKAGMLAAEGITSDEESIEKQKHKTKRFRVKDSWLPL